MSESTENTFVDKPSVVELPDEVRKYKSSGLPRIFASGDMRLMKCINNGNNTVHPIHSQYEDMDGLNFLGNLTNIKQHIQFVKYITGKCAIPKKMLHLFLKAYEIDKYFNEAYIFQITSMQIAEKDGFQVLSSIEGDNIKRYTQTEEDFVEDIKTLISLIPAGRKVIFINDIYPELVVESAETIPELYTITALLRTATVNAEFNKHSVRFFDYNKLQTTPFFKQLFAENSTEFKPMGLGFSFIMLNEYFIKP